MIIMDSHFIQFITTLQKIMNLLKELDSLYQLILNKKWQNRKWLIRPLNQERPAKGFLNLLYKELKDDLEKYFKYFRMDVDTFQYLLKIVQPHLLNRKHKNAITVEERLALTIRYLASGDDIFSLALLHRVGESTAYNIIHETCAALVNTLSPIYLKTPVKQAWRNISEGFLQDWNMPNCLGAIDGKHISIIAPPNSGSCFYNYKGFHSIVLLAVCNQRYEFTIVNVGSFGGESDGGILSRSSFEKSLKEGSLDIPKETKNLPGSNTQVSYYFVGDEAFPLCTYLMRPFPGKNLFYEKRIFNYRLSRARRCIENAFGILTARWRVLKKAIACYPHHADIIILACVCLHNFLMAQTQNSHRSTSVPDDFEYCSEIETTQSCFNYNSSQSQYLKEAHVIRKKISEYFLSPEGEVPWQKDYVTRGMYSDS